MNICVIDPLKLKGGQEKFILELSDSLKIYFNIHFLAENFEGFKYFKFSSTISFNNFGSFFRFKNFFRIYNYLKINEINLLVLNGERSLIIGFLLSFFLPKIRTLYINHLVFETSISKVSFIKRFFYLGVYNLAVKNVDYFVSISSSKEFLKNNLKYKGPQFYYIDNAIKEIKVGYKILRSTFNLLPNDILVGFVGRIDKQKDVETLIKAVKFCDDNIKFLIIGDGPQLNYLKSMISQDGIKNVTFVGFSNEPWEYASIIDIIVFPSLYEGLSLSLLEAMSLKLPIIASDIPSFRHCLSSEESCLFFECSNEKDLAAKINMLALDSERMSLIKTNAYNIYINNFNYHDMVLKYINLFKSIK